jgi:hypothetical protein
MDKKGELLPTLYGKYVKYPVGFCRLHSTYMNKRVSTTRCGYTENKNKRYCKHYIILTEEERIAGLDPECMEQSIKWRKHHEQKLAVQKELTCGSVDKATEMARELR